MNNIRFASNIDKKDGKVKHAYSLLKSHYFYILSIQDHTLITDYIGVFTAQADENITNLDCGKGYEDDFNFLLKDTRITEIISLDERLASYTIKTKPGDTFEAHKHPFTVVSPIEKGATFSWISKSRYIMDIPTAEKITAIRNTHRWYSTQNQFQFYDTIHNVKGDYVFYLFAPLWMQKYDSSGTFTVADTDNGRIDEEKLKKDGVHITREIIQTNPLDILQDDLPANALDFDYFSDEYYGVKTTIRVENYRPEFFDIALLFGFLMPEEKIWKQHLK